MSAINRNTLDPRSQPYKIKFGPKFKVRIIEWYAA